MILEGQIQADVTAQAIENLLERHRYIGMELACACGVEGFKAHEHRAHVARELLLLLGINERA